MKKRDHAMKKSNKIARNLENALQSCVIKEPFE